MAARERKSSLSLVLTMTLAFTVTLTQGRVPDCYYSAVPLYQDSFLDTRAGVERQCAPGTIFNQAKCTCVHGTPTKPPCTRTAVPTDETRYTDTVTGLVTACPPGKIFNQADCRCKKDFRRTCTPRFSLDFKHRLKNKVIRYNVGGEETLQVAAGHGKFNRKTSVIFWTFMYRPFEPEFQIQFEFRDDPATLTNQVLLTNCDAIDSSNAPSLLMYLDKSKANSKAQNLVRVLMRTDRKPQGVEVVAPYNTGETNILVVLKTKDILGLRVIQQNRNETFSSNPLEGRVLTSTDFLRLGACPGNIDGFTGDLDWFDYFPCWPRM